MELGARQLNETDEHHVFADDDERILYSGSAGCVADADQPHLHCRGFALTGNDEDDDDDDASALESVCRARACRDISGQGRVDTYAGCLGCLGCLGSMRIAYLVAEPLKALLNLVWCSKPSHVSRQTGPAGPDEAISAYGSDWMGTPQYLHMAVWRCLPCWPSTYGRKY